MAKQVITIPEQAKVVKLDPEQWGIKLEMVDPNQILIDRQYQRAFRQPKADKIAKFFDKKRFVPIHVSRRSNGKQYVVDGQHRLVAARMVKLDWIPALIETDTDVAGEADQFLGLNFDRTAPDAIAKFRAAKVAGYADALEVQEILDRTGWQLAKDQHNANLRRQPGVFASPSTALRMYDRYGADVLEQALNVLRNTPNWDKDNSAANSQLVAGMARLLFKFGDVIIIKRLTNKLSSVTPTLLLTKAKQYSDAVPTAGGFKMEEAVAQILFDQYQKNKHGRKIDWNARTITMDPKTKKAKRKIVQRVRPDKPTVDELEEPALAEEEADAPRAKVAPEVSAPVSEQQEDDFERVLRDALKPPKS